MPKFHNDALNKLTEWTDSEDNIRAVVLTGSGARENELDELSDLDIELYVREPSMLLNSSDWYSQFGEVVAVEALPNPDWHPTRLVYYVKGKIDFMVAPIEALAGTTYSRPFRVLVDKDEVTNSLRLVPGVTTALPTQAEFDECNNWFWAAALMCAKCIVRNEPWLAKVRDWDAKSELMRMIEWDHKARHGREFETWYQGKHLGTWMDDDVRVQLDALWAGFPVAETAQALIKTMRLFETLADRTSKTVNLGRFDSERARAEVMRILDAAKAK